MSVTRAGQYPFEIVYPAVDEKNRGLEIQSGGPADILNVDNSEPYTGVRAVHHTGVLRSGIGITFPATDDVECAMTVNHDWAFSGSHPFFRMEKSGQSAPAIHITLTATTLTWGLYIDGVNVQNYPMFDAVPWEFFQGKRRWTSHGFYCIGGSRFVYTIDGLPIIDYNDAGVPGDIEAIWFLDTAGSGWNVMRMDDFYINLVPGESYAVPDTLRFVPSMVDADGGTQDWASFPVGPDDWTAVDDATVDDDDTFNWTPSTNSPQNYNTANITLPADHDIVAAVPFAVCRRGDASRASQIRLRTRNGAYQNGSDQNLPLWYTEVWDRFPLNAAGNPWTEALFNAEEFGAQSRGTV